MIKRNIETYESHITDNFKVKEFFVSEEHKDWAYQAYLECHNQVFNNIQLLALMEQEEKEYLNKLSPYEVYIYNTSGYRNFEMNLAIGGAKRSYHLQGMAVDSHLGKFNYRLPQLYDWLQDGICKELKPSQVILYQDHKGHPLFIHRTIPQPGVKQSAWIEER